MICMLIRKNSINLKHALGKVYDGATTPTSNINEQPLIRWNKKTKKFVISNRRVHVDKIRLSKFLRFLEEKLPEIGGIISITNEDRMQ